MDKSQCGTHPTEHHITADDLGLASKFLAKMIPPLLSIVGSAYLACSSPPDSSCCDSNNVG
jgi:hypothetical protein